MKKKLFYIVLAWLAGFGAAFGQVTGEIKLVGQTDHSGAKIKFIAKSPTAKTDSTVSNSDGTYSINLKPGNYFIEFGKSGYPTRNYNRGTITFLNSNTQLSTVSLIDKDHYLKGQIKGVVKKHEVYIVDSSVTIADSDTLLIEPGALVYFNQDVKLEVVGDLIIKGLQNDSIYLLPYSQFDDFYKNTTWNGIYKQPTTEKYFAKSTIDVKYCRIESGTDLFNGFTECSIQNSTFINCYGIVNKGSNLIFKNNFSMNSTNIGSAVNESSYECNRFYDSREFGQLFINASNLRDNYFKDIHYIKFMLYSKINSCIVNNIIANSYLFEYLQFTNTNIETVFNNNTIISNKTNLTLANLSPFYFRSNIFISEVDIKSYQSSTPLEQIKCRNNLFTKELFSETLFPSSGILISTNNNGDPVDTYFNLFQDPKFLNGNAPYLASNSPAIGAGIDANENPVNIGFDPTGTCLERYFYNPNSLLTVDTLSIAGLVHQGSGLLSNGVVIAVEKVSGKARYQKVSNGVFKIDSLRKSEYILYAVPNPVTVTGYLPTYYVNKVKLSEAISLNLIGKIKDVDIYLVAKLTAQTGNSTIQGRFSYADNNTDDTTEFVKNWFGVSYAPASPIFITGNPCKNLPVLLYNGNNELVQSTVTDIDGYFGFQNISSGTYKALGQRVNYSTENSGQVVVDQNSTTTASFRLERIVDGIEEEAGLSNVNVFAYPNPFKDELQLKGYNGKVSIYDLAGNLYFETMLQSNERINSSTWPSGFYLLKTGDKVQKLIKQE